jgi:hypothetical protein
MGRALPRSFHRITQGEPRSRTPPLGIDVGPASLASTAPSTPVATVGVRPRSRFPTQRITEGPQLARGEFLTQSQGCNRSNGRSAGAVPGPPRQRGDRPPIGDIDAKGTKLIIPKAKTNAGIRKLITPRPYEGTSPA